MERLTKRSAVGALIVVASVLAGCGGAGSGSLADTPGARPASVVTFGVAGTRGPVAQTAHVAPTPIRGLPADVVAIATSNSDTYALTRSGAVWAWGVGNVGQLGNGTTPLASTRAVRVDFPPGVRITSLANPMPFDGALAIDAQGRAFGWGFNVAHDLCLGGGAEILRPEELPLAQVTLATGARTHSLVYAASTLYACGDGQFGELGNGTTSSSNTPTAVKGLPAGRVRLLTSSWGGSGALMADGSYYDWGYNQAGQLGDGTTNDSAVPVRVALAGPVVGVFQGGSGPANGQTVALLADHSLWLWGNGRSGQLGTGTRAHAPKPVRVTLPEGAVAVSVASGGYASYAIDRSGHLWAWGRNRDGQLGTGRAGPDRLVPTPTGLAATEVSSTAQNVAVLKPAGPVGS